MAASHRSPLMRDQWRSEDKYKDDTHYSGRGTGGHRRDSPSASKPQNDTDIGVKIRGRAAADTTTRPSSRGQRLTQHEGSRKESPKVSYRSPQRRSKGEGPSRRPREVGLERFSDQYPNRYQDRDTFRASVKQRRSRSRKPYQVPATRREDRRRSRSPVALDRNDRAPRIRSRHRERAYSDRASPRGDYYSANYDDITTSRSNRDSYVPSTRRSRSPTARDSRPSHATHRRSHSPSKRERPRERSSARCKQDSSRNSRSIRPRDPLPSFHPTRARSRDPSNSRHPRSDHRRRESQPRSPVDSRQPTQRRRRSRTPPGANKGRNSRNMRSLSRPVQSTSDDGPRPPSPPRPIPSFDSETHNPNAVRDAYPMHGMKANDMHGDSRTGRPQIDTRQPYTTSPQWTPTSSHHGSPQSGSPFSHGRGGWGGPQQFHGQPGYVLLIFIYVYKLIHRSV